MRIRRGSQTFLDVLVISKHHNTHIVRLQVQGHSLVEELAGFLRFKWTYLTDFLKFEILIKTKKL